MDFLDAYMVHRQLEVDTIKCSRSVSAMDGLLVGRRNGSMVVYCMVISGLVYVVSPQEFLVVVEQVSHRVKAGLLQLNSTLLS